MQDVFISYSTKNQADADFIRRVLESNAISCWMAPDSIPSGSNYAKEIPNAIRNARVFLLVLSQSAQLSIWVPKELDLAVNEGKTIVPFMIEDCEILDEFNFYLIGAQRLNAYCQRAEAMNTLVNRIQAVLSETSATPLPKVQEWTRQSPGTPTEKSLAAFAKMYIQKDIIKGHKHFRLRKEQALRQSLNIPETDEIFLGHDDTLFQNGKNGFAMCTSGIYCREIMDECSFLSWSNFIKTQEFQNRGTPTPSSIYACTTDGEILIAYVNLLDKPDRDLLVRFLTRLCEAMRKAYM